MRNKYYTNFIMSVATGKVIMAIDYDTALQSLRGMMDYEGIKEVKVERVGPLSDAPLFETPSDWEPEAVRNRIAY